MKKKIIFIIMLLIFIAVLFLIPKETYKKIFGSNSTDQPSSDLYDDKIFVYMCDDNDLLVGVYACVESLEEDLISQKFDVLVKKTGAFKENYDTTINTSTKLLSYEINDGVLTLDVSSEFLESEGRTTLEQLVWSFCDDETKELNLLVDGKAINVLNGFYFDKLTLDMGINITCESNFIFESNATTVIKYQNDLVVPITYIYDNLNECDFIISKLFSDIYENNEYEYVINNDSIIIDLALNASLSDDLKRSIKETIQYNLDINNIQVQGLNQVLLEINEESGL